jgi:hypothetical protein
VLPEQRRMTPQAVGPVGTDKHSKRYVSRRFREQLSGSWRPI